VILLIFSRYSSLRRLLEVYGRSRRVVLLRWSYGHEQIGLVLTSERTRRGLFPPGHDEHTVRAFSGPRSFARRSSTGHGQVAVGRGTRDHAIPAPCIRPRLLTGNAVIRTLSVRKRSLRLIFFVLICPHEKTAQRPLMYPRSAVPTR
jgi:hypothetical protein